MYEVKAITYDDEWQLIGELGLLEEVLDLLRIVVITFATDVFDL